MHSSAQRAEPPTATLPERRASPEAAKQRSRDTDAALFLDAGAGFPDASRDRGRAEGVWVWKSAEVLPRRSVSALPARYTVPRHVNAVLPAH